MKRLRETVSFDFSTNFEKHATDFQSNTDGNRFNPYNVSRVRLHEHLLYIAPLYAPDWIADTI